MYQLLKQLRTLNLFQQPIGLWLVCYTAVFSVVTQHSSPLSKKSFNKNDRDQVLWARETEHPTKTLVFTNTAGRNNLVSKVFPFKWGGALRDDAKNGCVQ